MWGDLFNRPDCGFVQSGKKREANNSRHSLLHAFASRSKQKTAKEAEISLLASFAFIGSIASPYSCLSGRAVQPRSGLD
jgi:hypothetical protein